MLQTNPLEMKLALELRKGLQIGEGDLLEDYLHAPK
jgi:hypothetical protein